MAKGYSKHKERDPRETVDAIRGILARAGLDVELHETENSLEGMWSNQITIAGTTFGAYGKGTSEAYAMASGYAELMERIQNGVLILYPPEGPAAYAKHGYLAAPDERYTPAPQIVARHCTVLEAWLSSFGVVTDEERLALLEELPRLRYDRGDGAVAEVPFADFVSGKVVWVPAALVVYTCGSNGMAAGNTWEEALVQGLSEVFERFVMRKVLRGEAVPPRIPRHVLAASGVADLVGHVERGGRYEVRVYDASLGCGYPVVMTTMADRKRATFGVRFGAHPSLPIAIERTLTEAFQGRNVLQCTSMNRFGSVEEAASLSNITSMAVSGLGVLPLKALSDEPGWSFAPWPSWEGGNNGDMLRSMLTVLARNGFRPLVRDVSHLGFPSYQIVVPGMSEVFAPSAGLREALVAKRRAKVALSHFPTLSTEERGHFLELKPSDLVHTSPSVFGPPFMDGRMHPCRVFGLLHLARGEFEEARECFEVFSRMTGEAGLMHWRAMARYASCRAEGLDHEEALRIVRFFCPPAIAQHVEHDAVGAIEDLGMVFPQMSCPDCSRCQLLACGVCAGLASMSEVFGRIARAMRHSTVSQEPLLNQLRQIGAGEVGTRS